MTPEQRAAIVNAAIARAMIRALGAWAENMQRAHCGQSMAYTDDAISAIIDEEGIGHNAVIAALRD